MTLNLTEPAKGKARDYGIGRQLTIAAVLFATLLAGAGGWAATARLNAAILGSGLVKVDRELKTVQHRDGGSIAEILAVPGQAVEQGQVIMRLDAMNLEGERTVRLSQLVDLSARAARLQALVSSADLLAIPERFAADPAALAVFSAEQDLLTNSRRDLETRVASAEARIAQLSHEAERLTAREATLHLQRALAEDAMDRAVTLKGKGTGSDVQKDAAAGDLARVEGEIAETRAGLAGNAAQVTELQLEMGRMQGSVQLEAQMALRELEPKIDELTQQIGLLQAEIDRTEIRAPIAGIVNELAVNTIGQVIAPAERLATIVPADADLVIEFQIAPTDIDQIEPGQTARLRFTAFNQKTTPEVAGVIYRVAAAATTDPVSGTQVFLAQVRPADEGNLPAGVSLVPGMPVEVMITTRERTALEYIVEPVRQSLARSMLEE